MEFLIPTFTYKRRPTLITAFRLIIRITLNVEVTKMNFKTFRLNREELYEQVWSQPMTKLASTYSLSDNGLRKICKKHDIPLPTLGYWAKMQHGKKVERLPLPPTKGSGELEIKIYKKDDLPIDEEQFTKAQELITFENLDENKIQVPSMLVSPHILISQTKKAFQNSKTIHHAHLSPNRNDSLNIDVCPNNLNRALRIMDILIKALESRKFEVLIIKEQTYGNYIRCTTCVSLLGQNIKFRLRERLLQKDRVQKHSYDNKYDYVPSGKLNFEIIDYLCEGMRKIWTDTTRIQLENRLNAFIVGLIKAAVNMRSRELQRERRKRERQEAERQREENERQIMEEKRKVDTLYKDAENWTKSQHMRKYITTVKKNALQKNEKIEHELEQWLKWANQQADRLDPFKDSPPSILDQQHSKVYKYPFCY